MGDLACSTLTGESHVDSVLCATCNAVAYRRLDVQLSVDGRWAIIRCTTMERIIAGCDRVDTPRPTVHARNLFHLSAAMYDAWASFDPTAAGYYSQEKAAWLPVDTQAARNEAISFAAYQVLQSRFANSPGAAESLSAFRAEMIASGYDPDFNTAQGNTPAALGNRIAGQVLARGLQDGANESHNYTDTTGYVPVNPPLDVSLSARRWLTKIAGNH